MGQTRDRVVYVALVVSESAWLFAVCGLLGAGLGLGGSPLSWLAVLALLGSASLVASSLQPLRLPLSIVQAIHVIAGAIAIYLTMATQLVEKGGIELGWAANLSKDGVETTYITSVIVGLFFAIVFWWRGTKLATIESPAYILASSFKVGVLVLAVAAVVDISSSQDLMVPLVAFPFFGAGMAGLAISHLLPSTEEAAQGRTWMRVVGGTVGGVLVLGVLFSFLRGSVVSAFTSGIVTVLAALHSALAFIILIPIEFIAGFIIRAIVAFVNWLGAGDREEQEILQQGGLPTFDVEEKTGTPIASIIGDIAIWVLVALLILAVIYLLARAFRQRMGGGGGGMEGMRESLWGEAVPGEDLGALLVSLLPESLRRIRRGRRLRVPEGEEKGIVEAFRIYFRLLSMADAKGSSKPSWQTPAEYRENLELLFPDAPVQMATAAFDRACYGHMPATEQDIAFMTSALDRVAAEDEYKHSRRKKMRDVLFGERQD